MSDGGERLEEEGARGNAPAGAAAPSPWLRALAWTAPLCLAALTSLALTPPLQFPDAYAHFFRSAQIAHGVLLGEKRGDASGGVLPALTEEECLRYNDISGHPDARLRIEDLEARFHASPPLSPEREADTRFIAFSNTVLTSPIPYVPAALGIALAERLHLLAIAAVYLASLFTLAATSLALLFSFRALSSSLRARCIAFAVAGLPMTLFLFGTFSADSLTISLSILACALALRLHERFDRRVFLAFLACSALAGCCKTVYFMVPLAVLPLVLSGEPLFSRRGFARIALAAAAAVAPMLVWTLLARPLYSPLLPGVDAPQQASYVLHHLGQTAWRFAKGIYRSRHDTFAMMAGDLGWLDALMSPGVQRTCLWLLLLTPLFAARGDDARRRLRWSQITWMWLAFAAFTFLLSLSQYLTWNQPGGEFTVLQGRYFTPFAFAVLFLWPQPIRLSGHWRSLYAAAFFAVWTTLWWSLDRTLLHRYWSS